MAEAKDRDREILAAIEDALESYPLVPAPPGLYPATMARIRALAVPPRFRLAWLDWAISLLVALMAGLALLLWRSMPPETAFYLHMEMLLFQERLRLLYPWPPLRAELAVAAASLLAAAILFANPMHPTVRPKRTREALRW